MAGMIRHGAELVFAYAEATVPQGVPGAAQGLRRRLHSHGLQGHGQRPVHRLAERRGGGHGRRRSACASCTGGPTRRPGRSWSEEYREKFLNPYVAAERGFVDMVIDPAETRQTVARCFDAARDQAGAPRGPQARQQPALVPHRFRAQLVRYAGGSRGCWPRTALAATVLT